ncbi:DNA photolyase family protein, partial [Vibrio parahaemolyticus AQ3810]
ATDSTGWRIPPNFHLGLRLVVCRQE